MVKLSSPQSFKVVRYILEHPRATQSKVSTDTGVSIGLVNHVAKPLFELGVCRRGRWKSIELTDPLRLLEILSWERQLRGLVKATVRLEVSEVSRAEKMIDGVCRENGVAYALTSFSSLNHYLPYYITFPTIHVYAPRFEKLEGLLQSGRGAVSVEVLEPDHDVIMNDLREVHGLKLVSPVQTVIDLFCFGEGGRDGAMKLLQRMGTSPKAWSRGATKKKEMVA